MKKNLVGLLLVAFLFLGYQLYTPNYLQMQRSTVLLEIKLNDDTVGHASGVLVGDGYILTAGHVTETLKNEQVTIYARFRQGESSPTQLVEMDFDNEELSRDIALLRTPETHDYPSARISCEAQSVGTELFIVGHPISNRWVTTHGYVMGTIPRAGREDQNWLQIDGTIWKGNSGGPVFNLWGEVVGITSHGQTSLLGGPIGLNFAVSGPIFCEFLSNVEEWKWNSTSPALSLS